MTGPDLELEKRRLRALARGLGPAGIGAGARAQERLLALPELTREGVVCLYAARGHEVPTAFAARVLAARGVALAFPRVCGSGMLPFRVGGVACLVPGYRGILEPPADSAALEPARVSVYVVPGLLFDRRGGRLGRGGGHYDRLLELAGERAARIGLCYAERVRDRIPLAPWDRSMHCVVTEREVIRP